jgi:predicted GNAT superfamily acetyltransferase
VITALQGGISESGAESVTVEVPTPVSGLPDAAANPGANPGGSEFATARAEFRQQFLSLFESGYVAIELRRTGKRVAYVLAPWSGLQGVGA